MTALVVLLAISTALFTTVGFKRNRTTDYSPIPSATAPSGAPVYRPTTVLGPRPGWTTALDYSIQSTTSLLRPLQNLPSLYAAGRALEISLRLAGPGLLALAVLAIRARVKR